MSTSPSYAAPLPDASTSGSSVWRLVSKRSSDIVAITPGGRRPAFYCIHSVAGDVTGYFELGRLLGPDFAFYGVQVPKQEMIASRVVSIETLSARYVQALTTFQPEGPLIIGGFSAGAIIALEVAQQLRALGRDVPLLIALDGAPSNTTAGMKRWAPRYIFELSRNAARCLRDLQLANVSPRRIGARLYDRLVCRTSLKVPFFRSGQTIDVMAMLNVLDRPGWNTEYKLFMRAMYEAMYAYVPKPYAGRVLLYEIEQQPLFHLRQIGAVWSSLSPSCEIFSLRGKHGQFFVEQTLRQMVAHLRRVLTELQAAPVSSQLVVRPVTSTARPEGALQTYLPETA